MCQTLPFNEGLNSEIWISSTVFLLNNRLLELIKNLPLYSSLSCTDDYTRHV